MFGAKNWAYLYDGSFEGFLCCIYESYVRRQNLLSIKIARRQAASYGQTEWIQTDLAHADKVYVSLAEKICLQSQDFVREAFLFDHPMREMWLYYFIRMGYQMGRAVMDYKADNTINTLVRAVHDVHREARLTKGYTRFSSFEDVLLACIAPRHRVLPLLSKHYADAYPKKTLLIYDKTHQMALVQKADGVLLSSMRDVPLPPINDAQEAYRTLWTCFFESMRIDAHAHQRHEMNRLPRRLWQQMTEFDLEFN